MRKTAILALIALIAGAQTPTQNLPNIKFTATSNLVIVDVTVKDKAGSPIDNLKAKDFTVLEDGKPQKISVFEFQKLSEEPAPPAPPPSIQDKDVLPEDPVTTISAEDPGKVQYHDKRLLVLFFDFSSMEMPEQLRAQEAALKFLDTQITPSDLVAVMLYTADIQVKTDFTSDRDVLRDVINALPIGEMAELADMADTGDEDEEDTGSAFVADESEFNIFNTDRKLAAIEDATRKLSALPEKKALIYFSSGVGKTGIENQAQLEASINAAVKANLAIYPVDARGLIAAPPGGSARRGATRGAGVFSGSVQNKQRLKINDSQETLSTLASDTGGKAFLDSNDLSLGIVQAQKEMRSYYILGYYTTNTNPDGKYRKISVKLNNHLTAKLEHRQGYYAERVWGKLTGQDKEQQLEEALSAANPETDLPLALEVDYFRISPLAYFVPVSLKIPGSVIALAEKNSGGETQFDFIGQVLDERRSVVGAVRDSIKVKLDTTDAKTLAARSFHYDAGFTLAPGRYRMKFLVRENLSGKMGTFDTRFVVPDLVADSMALKTSSVIWSSQREPLKAAVGAAEKAAKKIVAANPLVTGQEKVVPSVTKVFRRSQSLYVSFDVYDAASDPAEPRARDVEVSLSLFNAKGLKAFQAGPVRASELAPTRPEAVPVQLQVPLKGLAPGRYTCQINVLDVIGRKFAFPRTTMVIR